MTTPLLHFDAERHEYRLHGPETPPNWGRILPSVTQVLERSGLVEVEWFTPESRERGRAVHKMVMYEEREGLDESSVDPRLAGYLKAYRTFIREVRPGPCELLETPLADPALGYAGTPDQVRCLVARSLFDLKSGTAAAWHALQTAGYANLLALHNENWRGLRRYALYLTKDGKYRLIEHADRRDFKVFQAALVLDQFKGNDR